MVGIVGSFHRCGVPRWKEPSTILPRTSSGSHRRAGALVQQLSPNSWATLARWVWCLGVWWQWLGKRVQTWLLLASLNDAGLISPNKAHPKDAKLLEQSFFPPSGGGYLYPEKREQSLKEPWDLKPHGIHWQWSPFLSPHPWGAQWKHHNHFNCLHILFPPLSGDPTAAATGWRWAHVPSKGLHVWLQHMHACVLKRVVACHLVVHSGASYTQPIATPFSLKCGRGEVYCFVCPCVRSHRQSRKHALILFCLSLWT